MVEATETRTPETEIRFVGRGLRLIGSTFAALGSLVVVTFIGIFLAWEPRAYVEGFVQLFPQRRGKRAREVLGSTGHMLKRWLAGQLILMAIVATVTGIGLTLLGVPFALPLALLAGLLEFVPWIQHRAVYLPPALILFSQVVLGVTAGPLGVIVATPLAAATLVAVNMLYVEDVLGDKPAIKASGGF